MRMAQRHPGKLCLDVFERNAVGRPFYESYGFREVGRYRHEGSGEMTITMELPESA
jgi:putative acetyltransferase